MKKYLILIIIFLLSGSIAYSAGCIFPIQGGTGTCTKPTFGQILVGNSGGTYTLTATSSLGLLSGGGGVNMLTYWTGNNSIGATSSPTFTSFTATSTTATSTVAGNLWVQKNLQVDGQFYAPIQLVSSGNAKINGNLDVTGIMTVDSVATSTVTGGLVISTSGLSSNALNITGDSLFGGKLTVSGASTSTAPQLNVSTGLTTPYAIITSILKSTGSATSTFAGGILSATGGLSTNALNVTSDSLLGGKLVVSGAGNSSFAGNVGIGTTGPTSNLHVYGSGSTIATIETSGTSTVIPQLSVKTGTANVGFTLGQLSATYAGNYITSPANVAAAGLTTWETGSASTGLHIGEVANAPIIFTTNGYVERMRITGGGNVGIGTTNPGSLLDVAGVPPDGSTLITARSTSASSVSYGGIVAQNKLGRVAYLTVGDASYTPATYYAKADWITLAGSANLGIRMGANGRLDDMVIATGGNVGIGTTSPRPRY